MKPFANILTTNITPFAKQSERIMMVNKAEEVAKISDEIMSEENSSPVLGVDCEGISLSKSGPLCLIQISFKNVAYIFDLLAVNAIEHGLSKVFMSKKIIKVFHDCCEDSSALYNQFNLQCERIFDTQVAHRILCEIQKNLKQSYGNINISLNKLLAQYVNSIHESKEAMHQKMKEDPEFWHKRPLTQDMLDYAAKDVIFLPRVFTQMRIKMHSLVINKELNEKLFENHFATNYADRILEHVFAESTKFHQYSLINLHLTPHDIKKTRMIKALVKNFQKIGVYCSINIGYSGLIMDPESVSYIRKFHQIGDVVDVEINEILEDSNKIILSISKDVLSKFSLAKNYNMQKHHSSNSYGELLNEVCEYCRQFKNYNHYCPIIHFNSQGEKLANESMHYQSNDQYSSQEYWDNSYYGNEGTHCASYDNSPIYYDNSQYDYSPAYSTGSQSPDNFHMAIDMSNPNAAPIATGNKKRQKKKKAKMSQLNASFTSDSYSASWDYNKVTPAQYQAYAQSLMYTQMMPSYPSLGYYWSFMPSKNS